MKKIAHLIILCLILASSNIFAKEKMEVSLSFDSYPRQYSDIILKVDFKIPEGVHIYANEPQDMGLPTQVEIVLPKGFEIMGVEWSPTEEFEYMDMKSTGYANKATALFDIYVPRYAEGEKEITANISWLECSDTCDIGEAVITKVFHINELPSPRPFSYLIGLSIFAFMAFVGGMILNLMPCVFPIIGIKVLSFIKGADNNKSKALLSALSYSLGIVLSFLALGGLLLIFKSMGLHYGWGFQLQEPIFVALMIVLFFAMALSFSGLFEIGTSLGNLGNNANAQKNNYLSSFMSGVLAVLVASPCTAPYMGTAVGAVLLEDYDAFKLIVIFTSLGLGMAFPYVALTLIPRLHKFLPRAGEWLNTFKQFLAFLLYATCIWLFWVYSKQGNTDSSALLLFALLVLSLGLFIYGKWQAPHFSKAWRAFAIISAIVGISGSIYIAKVASIDKIQGESEVSTSGAEALDKIQELRDNGEIVFVDFTAAWCVTCQSNKKLVLNTEATKQLFEKHNIKVVTVDWTKRNPIIGEELKKFGAIGVPLYLLYGKDAKEPIVLPNILTYSILEEAIANSRN